MSKTPYINAPKKAKGEDALIKCETLTPHTMINCAGCDEAHPIPDIIELYAQLVSAPKKPEGKLEFAVYAKLLNAAFDDFLWNVKQAGYALNISGGKTRPKSAYIPKLDVTLIAPLYHTGLATIRINNPTQSKLGFVQGWLDSYFPDKTIMQNCVKLHKLELAFDFKFAEDGSQDDYAALALRIVRSLHTRYAQNTYAVYIGGEPSRCRDKAGNGKYTFYLQSAKRKDRYVSSDKLHRNIKTAKHTKIYPKKQHKIWGLRIECTPSPSALKKILKDYRMPFDPQNISSVLQLCGMIRFSNLYEFKQCDPIRFSRHIPKQTKFSRRIMAYVSRRWLEEAALMPVVEAMRAMSCVRSRYGIHYQTMARCSRTISFTEAASLELPEGFKISQRKRSNKKRRHKSADEFEIKLPEDVLIGAGTMQLVPFHNENMEQDTPVEQTSLLAKCVLKSPKTALLTNKNEKHDRFLGEAQKYPLVRLCRDITKARQGP